VYLCTGEKVLKFGGNLFARYIMNKRLSFSGLMQLLKGVLGDLPELRKGKNKTYRTSRMLRMRGLCGFFHAVGLLSGESESHAKRRGAQ